MRVVVIAQRRDEEVRVDVAEVLLGRRAVALRHERDEAVEQHVALAGTRGAHCNLQKRTGEG